MQNANDWSTHTLHDLFIWSSHGLRLIQHEPCAENWEHSNDWNLQYGWMKSNLPRDPLLSNNRMSMFMSRTVIQFVASSHETKISKSWWAPRWTWESLVIDITLLLRGATLKTRTIHAAHLDIVRPCWDQEIQQFDVLLQIPMGKQWRAWWRRQ